MIEYEKHRSESKNYIYNQIITNLNFNQHFHKSFEFVYIFDGTLELTIDNDTYCLTCGNSALILPNQIHSYRTPRYSKCFLCIFSISFVYDFYEKTRNMRAINPVFKFGKDENINMLISKINSPDTGDYGYKSIFYTICDAFSKSARLITTQKDSVSLLDEIVLFLQENFREDISLKNIAASFGYTYNYLSGYLNKRFGINFRRLLNEYRINYACYLLLHTDETITNISDQCGYDTIRSFNRNFIAITNITPTAFRDKTLDTPLKINRK